MTTQQLMKVLIEFYNSARAKPDLFSSREFQDFNRAIHHLSLTGLGYNNYQNSFLTGEEFFITKIVSQLDVKVCFDVGANKGEWSKKVKQIHPGAELHAFEPLPDVFAVLCTELEDLADKHLNKMALSDAAGRAIIFHGNERTHASLSNAVNQIDYIHNDEESIIDVTTIDQYCWEKNIKNIDLLKIDVEGLEGKVLRGGMGMLLKSPPKLIQIEFNRHHLYENFTIYSLNQMVRGRYRLFQLTPGGWSERQFDWSQANIFEYSNFVLVRSDVIEEISYE
jgi:FkbM family methyltransferase